MQRNQIDQVSKHYTSTPLSAGSTAAVNAPKTGFYLAPISPPGEMSSMGNTALAKNLEATITELGFTDSLSWSTQSSNPPDTNVAHYPLLMYYYHPDYLGHVEYITDLDGTPYQYFYYTAWGETLLDQKATRPGMNFDSPYRFNGKELDDETGLYYYGARYYTCPERHCRFGNPKVSVWLGVDPLAHKYPNMTSYVFTGNNPINAIDPDGRMLASPNDPPKAKPLVSSAPTPPIINSSPTPKTSSVEPMISSPNVLNSIRQTQTRIEGSSPNILQTANAQSLQINMPGANLSEPVQNVSENRQSRQVAGGVISVTAGTLFVTTGIGEIGTGVGVLPGFYQTQIGISMIGFGLANIIDGVQGGEQSVPSGFGEALSLGTNSNPVYGQVFDLIGGGVPKTSSELLLNSGSILMSDVFQRIQEPRDQTNIQF